MVETSSSSFAEFICHRADPDGRYYEPLYHLNKSRFDNTTRHAIRELRKARQNSHCDNGQRIETMSFVGLLPESSRPSNRKRKLSEVESTAEGKEER